MLWGILLTVIVIYFIYWLQGRSSARTAAEGMIQQVTEYSAKYPDRYEFNVKGLHMASYQKRLAKCDTTDEVTLEPEPENKYDINAIKVMTAAGLIGYVPADKTDYVSFLISKDHDAFINEIDDNDGYVRCTIAILYNYKMNKGNDN